MVEKIRELRQATTNSIYLSGLNIVAVEEGAASAR